MESADSKRWEQKPQISNCRLAPHPANSSPLATSLLPCYLRQAVVADSIRTFSIIYDWMGRKNIHLKAIINFRATICQQIKIISTSVACWDRKSHCVRSVSVFGNDLCAIWHKIHSVRWTCWIYQSALRPRGWAEPRSMMQSIHSTFVLLHAIGDDSNPVNFPVD